MTSLTELDSVNGRMHSPEPCAQILATPIQPEEVDAKFAGPSRPAISYAGLRVHPALWIAFLLGTGPLNISHADALPETGPCACESVKARNGWCPACKVGYLAGTAIPSRKLFEVLDAHGHDIDTAALQCGTCRKAAADQGYCESCRIGFYRSKVYFTRLTYELVRGEPVIRSKLTCEACRGDSGMFRWCTKCLRGLVGNVVISRKESFNIAQTEFERLLLALKNLPRCEDCAVGLFMRTICPTCRRSFDLSGQAKPSPVEPDP